MAAGMINELYELVISICDQLYANRQLITKNSVKKLVLLHGSWSEDDLELQLSTYVNQWRLQTLQQTDSLEEQLQRYRAELLNLKRDIRDMLNG